jgi:hypothetical protein
MQKNYSVVDGQSSFDACLQTYGSLDFLCKMLVDSGIDNVNTKLQSQKKIVYDDEVVIDQVVRNQSLISNIIYATDSGQFGDTYYVITQPSPPPIVKVPTELPNTNNNNVMAQRVSATQFTSSADGTIEFSPLDKDNLSMIGYDIIQIEIEIKPLQNSQYVWNKNLGKVTLQGGLTIDNGQTAFIIYSQNV